MKTIKILEIVKTGTTDSLMRIPQVTAREDGTLWVNENTMPLCNSSGTLPKEKLAPLMEQKAWDEIPADNFLRLGENVGGKEAMDTEEVNARRLANRGPEEKARIEQAKETARKAREYDLIHNEGGEGYNPFRDQAEMDDSTPYHKGDNQPA